MSLPINKLRFAFKQIELSRQSLARNASLKQRDLDFVYQGLFLFAVKKFESYLEEQLIALATGAASWTPRRINGKQYRAEPTLHDVRSGIVRSLMIGTNDYPRLLPYDKCIELAELFLRQGVPFSILDEQEKGRLTRCQAIRNLIAHDSTAARTKFEKVVLRQYTLPSYRKNPAGYLRTQFSSSKSYFEAELSALMAIANTLA